MTKPKPKPKPRPSSRPARVSRLEPPAGARSVCPVACTLDIIGDRWTLLVIRDLLLGKSHFKEILESPERIATNILSQRLARLTEAGLVERFPSEILAGREAYRLTAAGRSLTPLLEQMAAWGLEHLPGTSARLMRRLVAAPG